MSARAAVTEYQAGGVNNRHLFPLSSGGWESKIRVEVDLVSFRGLAPWFRPGHPLAFSLDLPSVPAAPGISLCPNLLLEELQVD